MGDVDRFFGSQKSLGIYYKQKLLQSVEVNNNTIYNGRCDFMNTILIFLL